MMQTRDLDIITQNAVDWKMYEDSTVLITGATGRIGRYLLETLEIINQKYKLNMRLLGLARNANKVQSIFSEAKNLSENTDFLYQDINDEIVFEGNIDYIFHTAGPAAPIEFETPVDTLWAHVNGTHNVLECARSHCTKRVFYVSTVEIYGEWTSEKRIREEDMGIMRHLNARACYPESKRLCETLLATYKKQFGISFCGVRLCHTLGPGVLLDDGRGFAEFMNCVLNNKNIILHSDGGAMRTYTYMADAVNAMFLVMYKGKDMLYNVANPANLISIRDLAKMITSLFPDRNSKVMFSEEAATLSYLPYKLAVMDVSKAVELGWQPQTDIKNTFKWTMEAYL